MEVAKVAIVGYGAVGAGVARLLLNRADRIARFAGKRVELARVVDIDLKRPRSFALPPGLLTDDLDSVIADPEIAAVMELVNDAVAARSIVLDLLESGKNVVTANKTLLVEHGRELFERARKLGRSIAFEAALAGGIPIVAAITECLAANQIESLHGILNGTSNFILTQMEENDCEYSVALAEAQQCGYAEANPEPDTGGGDTAQKLAILAHLAFGARVDWRDIPRVGINNVEIDDVRYARELGYSIKPLAVAELVPEGLELHVSPMLIRHGTPLAEVRGAYNAVRIIGDAVGRIFLHGLGAGQMPTASAVISDLIDSILGRSAISFRTSNFWASDQQAPVTLRSPDNMPSRFYLRLNVEDRPNVMAEITGILGRHGISIASVIQHESEEDAANVVPLVIMTHTTSEGDVADAMKSIGQLSCVYPDSVRMRVRD
ncbi:MAG: homoserine dehydrogenase [Pirellulales bacterium]|nr:homoserine dehydrogenase [Pirellulales bacterium]